MADNVRVALWCCQRSMSTLFERCIAAGGDVEIFHEVYLAAYRFGPDRVQENANFENDDAFTFAHVHNMLRKNYTRALFLKDMAFAVEGRFSELPSTLQHAFLIRSPEKVVRSYLTLLRGCSFDASYILELRGKLPNSYKQQCRLFDHVDRYYRSSKRSIVVVDADDFEAAPREVVTRFCEETGLLFRESMLNWESLDDLPDEWHCSEVLKRATRKAGSYDKALRSTGVAVTMVTVKERQGGRQETGDSDYFARQNSDGFSLPAEWQECVQECEPFYEVMYQRKLHFSLKS